jgi:hypothetical protein
MTEGERTEIIRRIKGFPEGGKGAVFPIHRDDMSVVGYLRAIDRDILDDEELIAAMAAARTRHKRAFLTQFDVSPENKKWWLEHGVLKNDAKVLFLVEAHDHTVVGQDGFTILSGDTFSLDGTLRWIRYGCRDLYVRSGIERAAICFFVLGCKLSTTEVFGDNVANVKNSGRMGHEVTSEHGLFLSERNNALRYEKISGGNPPNTDRTLLYFTMTRESFIRRYPLIAKSYLQRGLWLESPHKNQH